MNLNDTKVYDTEVKVGQVWVITRTIGGYPVRYLHTSIDDKLHRNFWWSADIEDAHTLSSKQAANTLIKALRKAHTTERMFKCPINVIDDGTTHFFAESVELIEMTSKTLTIRKSK